MRSCQHSRDQHSTGQHSTGPAHRGPAQDGQASRPPDDLFRHEVLAVVLQVAPGRLHVLLWQRGAAPFEGCWALPGGPLGPAERLGTSASRHLASQGGHHRRSPTWSSWRPAATRPATRAARVLATAYLALVAADVDAAGSRRTRPGIRWTTLPPTAFDHGSIIGSARERLRAKLSYTNIGFALAPDDVHDRAAARHLRGLARPPGVGDQPAAHPDPPRGDRADHRAAQPTSLGGRPATLYRFAARALVVTNPFAAFRPPPPSAASPPPAPARAPPHAPVKRNGGTSACASPTDIPGKSPTRSAYVSRIGTTESPSSSPRSM